MSGILLNYDFAYNIPVFNGRFEPKSMFLLYYFEQDYDFVRGPVFISSYIDKTNAESAKVRLIQETQDKRLVYEKLKDRRNNKWTEFYNENLAFWERNKEAINNPGREDGLWCGEMIVKPARYSFKPSGFSFGNDEDYEDVKKTIILSPADINEIRNNKCKWLAGCTDYTREKYINWSLINEPFPLWIEDEEYSNWSFGTNYTDGNLFIEEIKVI